MKTEFEERPFSNQNIPYYYQIANLLRRKIEDGEFGAGDKIPKETELAEAFGVSRVPIRQALALLVQDGLLYRQRGRGTFVSGAFRKPKGLKLTGMIEEVAAHGMEGELRLIDVKNVSPLPNLSSFFKLSSQEKINQTRRVRFLENDPFCFVINYLPIGIARKIRRSALKKKSMLNILEKNLRILPVEMDQTIESRTADGDIASYLDIGIMSPIMYVETYVWGENQIPLEYSQLFYRGDRFKYNVKRTWEKRLK
ncbi:MAG: GntR family transcriptional regulator [Waddliaceae bacterium]